METGNNLHRVYSKNNLAETIIGQRLIINFRYDGLTLVAADPTGKQIVDIGSCSWLATKDEDQLVENAEEFFEEHNIALQQAAGIHWLFSVSKCSLLPDILHQKGQGHEILSFTSRLDEGENVYSDFWTRKDIVGLYALPQRVHDWAVSRNSKSTIAHISHGLNNLALQQTARKDYFLLMVSDSFAEFYIAREGKLTFYNQFPFDVFEDLLYYLLFTLEQHRILAPEVELEVTGLASGKGSDLYKLLNTYIGKVSDAGIPMGKTSATHITRNLLRQVAPLIASL